MDSGLSYQNYVWNRDLGMSPERLASLFGDIPVEAMEARYRAERMSDAA